jgi:eukaryotic-like serine/threonine-protein kinase
VKPGDKILHFEIIELLGSGGMGVVYKAHDTKLNRIVALKFLPGYLTNNEKEIARLKREALITASINHKSVAIIYDFLVFENYVFLVMEYIKGVTLKEAIKNAGPFSKQRAIEIIVEIAEGLKEAHDQNILHRDIKSDNIMITPDGELKIMDFGLAKLEGTPTLASSDSRPGTIAYMSPEQVEGRPIDNRSDIWSLGVMFYEILTGQLPFTGDNDATILYAIIKKCASSIKTIWSCKRQSAGIYSPKNADQKSGEQVPAFRRVFG